MTKPNSRRQRALDQLTIAQDALAKALTLLGGKPRYRGSKHLPMPRPTIARGYIVSCINRLDVAANLILPDSRSTPTLRDDFEREYDQEREPGC